METLTLYDLNEFIKQVVVLNFGQPVRVTCEISQVGEARGHRYIDLIQKDTGSSALVAKSAAVLWKGKYALLKRQYGDQLDQVLAAGNEVKLEVQVDYHERYGLKLIIQDVDVFFTEGRLAQKRLETINRLKQEGLMDKNKETHLPPVAQRIAIISSEGAAGLADFLAQIQENAYGYDFDLHLFPAAMQGKNTEPEVLAQLAEIRERKQDFDLVILIRGGGSKIDLADFDSYLLGKATASFPLPVWTGIGHEIDQSVADLVSYRSLKTPTAVANALIDHQLQFEQELLEWKEAIFALAHDILSEKTEQVNHNRQFLPVLSQSYIEKAKWALAQATTSIRTTSKMLLERQQAHLDKIGALIAANHPKQLLAKGYSMTYHQGKLIKHFDSIKEGDTIETVLANGTFTSQVKKTTHHAKKTI